MSRIEEIRAVEPMTDEQLGRVRDMVPMGAFAGIGGKVLASLLARLDRAEAALATADAAGFARGVEAAAAQLDKMRAHMDARGLGDEADRARAGAFTDGAYGIRHQVTP